MHMTRAVASTERERNGAVRSPFTMDLLQNSIANYGPTNIIYVQQDRGVNGHSVPQNGSQVRGRGRRRCNRGPRGTEGGQTRASSALEAETNSRGGFGRGRPQRGGNGHRHGGRHGLGPRTRGEPSRGASRTEPSHLLNGHGAFGGPALSGRGEPHHGPGPVHDEDGQGRRHGIHLVNGVNGTGTSNRTEESEGTIIRGRTCEPH